MILEVRSLRWVSWAKVSTGLVSSGGSRGEAVSLPFLVSRGHLHSLALNLFLYLQSHKYSIFKSFSLSLCF